MTDSWLAGSEGGRGLAQRGGEAGQGARPAATLWVAFDPGHGRQADSCLASEFGRRQAMLAA
jgi:hypothetical protein